jgi:hypothetical protein
MTADADAGVYVRNVMPSQVVQTIDLLFPHASRDNRDGHLQPSNSPQLTGILQLIRAIPANLIAVSFGDYAEFVLAVSTIDYHLRIWQSRPVGGIAPVNGNDAMFVIRRVLAECPDEYPPPATTELLFIADTDLRDSIRRDLGAAHRAFANFEWKASTVLAGAAIEALLLWKLQEPPRTPAAVLAEAQLLAAASKRRAPRTDLNRWDLDDYIMMAEHFKLLKDDTTAATKLAQSFRNLIHPGRAFRLQQTCDRGTALSALGALDHVIRDFT